MSLVTEGGMRPQQGEGIKVAAGRGYKGARFSCTLSGSSANDLRDVEGFFFFSIPTKYTCFSPVPSALVYTLLQQIGPAIGRF